MYLLTHDLMELNPPRHRYRITSNTITHVDDCRCNETITSLDIIVEQEALFNEVSPVRTVLRVTECGQQ